MLKNGKAPVFRSDAFIRVPTTGFEPAHLMAPPPQDGMSTNFTTWAEFSPCEFRAKIILFRNEKAVLIDVLQKSQDFIPIEFYLVFVVNPIFLLVFIRRVCLIFVSFYT